MSLSLFFHEDKLCDGFDVSILIERTFIELA